MALSKMQPMGVQGRRIALPRDISRPQMPSQRQPLAQVLRVAAPDTEAVESSRVQPSVGAGNQQTADDALQQLDRSIALRRAQRKREQLTYQAAAIAASVGISSLAILATYTRFSMHITSDGEMPWSDLLGTLSLVAGGAFGMEMYARYAHKALWHESPLGWLLHKSHHTPRTGPFEANDLFAIINGLPAMLLCYYGFWEPGMVGASCFGAGLGITLYGMAYMFIHDGLVHRRFPTGPISDLPYMKRLTVAHQIHHSGKYDGAPWGMFLGPQELEAIPGATEELDRLVADLDWSKRRV
nr:beta-carotene hydroxylase [Haematococcus lacustris]